MIKTWLIFYNGKLAARKLTQNGAQALAFELCKAKSWNVGLVEVRQELGAKNENVY